MHFPHTNGRLDSPDRTPAEGPVAGQSEIAGLATRFASHADCGHGVLRNTVAGVVVVGRASWAGTALQNFWCARRDSNPHDFTHCHLKAARLPIPPRALREDRHGTPDRINGADVTNQGWGDKACERSVSTDGRIEGPGSAGNRRFRQHLLDFDRDPVAIDQYHAAGDRQIVGKDLDLVRLGGIQFDDGTPAQAHYLMDWHGGGSEDHHQIDADFIEGWHWGPDGLTTAKLRGSDHHVMVSQWLMTDKALI